MSPPGLLRRLQHRPPELRHTTAVRLKLLLGQERLVNVDWEDMGYQDGKAWTQASDLEDFEDAFHNFATGRRARRGALCVSGRVMRRGAEGGTRTHTSADCGF